MVSLMLPVCYAYGWWCWVGLCLYAALLASTELSAGAWAAWAAILWAVAGFVPAFLAWLLVYLRQQTHQEQIQDLQVKFPTLVKDAVKLATREELQELRGWIDTRLAILDQWKEGRGMNEAPK